MLKQANVKIGPYTVKLSVHDPKHLDVGTTRFRVEDAEAALHSWYTPVLCTRHSALGEILRESFPSLVVKDEVHPRDIAGRVVIGILPIHYLHLVSFFVRANIHVPGSLYAAVQARKHRELSRAELLKCWDGIDVYKTQHTTIS